MSNFNEPPPPYREPHRYTNPREEPDSPWQESQTGHHANHINPNQAAPGAYPPYAPPPGRPLMGNGPNEWAYEHPREPYDGDTSVMSLKQWLITFLILLIPCASIVMPFVWAFRSNENLNRRNFFRALLIFVPIMYALFFMVYIFFMFIGLATFYW